MLRRLVPVPIKLVLILVGNDAHIASMEFLECFSHSRLLIIDNRALAAMHVSGLSNARLEAVNNRIKTTIKIGYGYRNLDNLIALVMLKCGGLNLQLPGRQ